MSADGVGDPPPAADEISYLNVESVQQAERDIEAAALRLEGIARAMEAVARWRQHNVERIDKVITVNEAINILVSQGAAVDKLPASPTTQRLYRIEYQGRDERVTANDLRTLALSVEADPQFLADAARMLRQVGSVFAESMLVLTAARSQAAPKDDGPLSPPEPPKVYPY